MNDGLENIVTQWGPYTGNKHKGTTNEENEGRIKRHILALK